MLVDRARNTFMSGGAQHDIAIDLAPDLPRVMADRRRIVQVLTNLFSNAARHMPDASPIEVGAVRDATHVALSVRDEGQGIAPERLAQLFNKYTRTDTGHGGRGVGGGLGLAICKGLVEAHGGRIRAESAGPGHGACFTFTIPVAVEAEGRAATAADVNLAHPYRGGGERARILVVDDDPRALRFVRDALTDAGYAVLVTGDHRELSHLVETERPDLVLLDLMLPETDGIELMRGSPELTGLPVIFISAYGRDAMIARALDSGAADYIVKPFSPTELVARIGAALRGRAEPEPFVLGELAIHYDERRVTVAGKAVELTATEFELLRVLSLLAGRVATYETLLHRVWRGERDGETALVRAFIKQLRRKLGDDPDEAGLDLQPPRSRIPHAPAGQSVMRGGSYTRPARSSRETQRPPPCGPGSRPAGGRGRLGKRAGGDDAGASPRREHHPRTRLLPQAHRSARPGAARRGVGGQRRREGQPLPPAGGTLPRHRGGRAALPAPRRRLRVARRRLTAPASAVACVSGRWILPDRVYPRPAGRPPPWHQGVPDRSGPSVASARFAARPGPARPPTAGVQRGRNRPRAR